MGGYYSSKTDFIRQQIKWFDDYHNPVITDNYGNILRFAFGDPDLTVSHEFFNISAITRWDLDMIDDAYESMLINEWMCSKGFKIVKLTNKTG